MEKILANLDGGIYQFSKTQYIKYLRNSIKSNWLPLDVYNAKYLGGIRYTEDLQNELNIMTDKQEKVCKY